MSFSSKHVLSDLVAIKNNKQSAILSRFFKTGRGQYGYGDLFLGIKVPYQRLIAKKYKNLPLIEIQKLLENKFHECRLTALFILIFQYTKSDKKQQKIIFDFYCKNINHVNNWDLVDLSAPNIMGNYLLTRSHRSLYNLAKSKNLWHRRIAVLSTFTFIRNNDFSDTQKLAKLLLKDEHDLIHKAVGWMLREIGKRDVSVLLDFLKKYHLQMPRTMYRYSIEKLDKSQLALIQ
jgi:3-methyladenine DNA glycosylase AlkD